MIYGEQFVYVIQVGNDGPVKVGIATDPQARLEQLQTANPFPLRLLATFSGGASLEREIHKRLAIHRMNGEWFHPHADVMAVVREEMHCQGRAGTKYSTRYAQCANCGVLLGGDEPCPESVCAACEEFAALRASGVDPFEGDDG